MTKEEAKELIKDFIKITGINEIDASSLSPLKKINKYLKQVNAYLDNPNRTIEFSDDTCIILDKSTAINHKLGDKVRVISNSNANQFEIGEIVTITQVNGDSYKAVGATDYWWINDSIVEAIDDCPNVECNICPNITCEHNLKDK